MDKILVFNRKAAEQAEPQVCHAWISITTPGDEPALIQINKKYTIGILRPQFHDIDTEVTAGTDPNGIPYLAPDGLHAREIYSFARWVHRGIEALYIHCDAGISRSAGVAAALSKIYFGDDSAYFNGGVYHPNMRVYRLILNLHNNLGTVNNTINWRIN